MAVYLFRNWHNDLDMLRPTQLLDQHFGVGLNPEELLAPLTLPHSGNSHPLMHNQGYYRPWRLSRQDSGSTMKLDKDAFQVNLDVQQFSPEEVTVKTVDNSIVVEGKHDEKQDEHGFISRHFVRKYILPDGHDIKSIASNLSSDGILTITVPKTGPAKSEERVIPIIHTGPHKKVQQEEAANEEKAE